MKVQSTEYPKPFRTEEGKFYVTKNVEVIPKTKETPRMFEYEEEEMSTEEFTAHIAENQSRTMEENEILMKALVDIYELILGGGVNV